MSLGGGGGGCQIPNNENALLRQIIANAITLALDAIVSLIFSGKVDIYSSVFLVYVWQFAASAAAAISASAPDSSATENMESTFLFYTYMNQKRLCACDADDTITAFTLIDKVICLRSPATFSHIFQVNAERPTSAPVHYHNGLRLHVS